MNLHEINNALYVNGVKKEFIQKNNLKYIPVEHHFKLEIVSKIIEYRQFMYSKKLRNKINILAIYELLNKLTLVGL